MSKKYTLQTAENRLVQYMSWALYSEPVENFYPAVLHITRDEYTKKCVRAAKYQIQQYREKAYDHCMKSQHVGSNSTLRYHLLGEYHE